MPPAGGASKLKRTITLTGSGPAVGGNNAAGTTGGAGKGKPGDAGGRDTFSELSKFHKAQVCSPLAAIVRVTVFLLTHLLSFHF